jgi:hypothetical protein
MRCVECDAPHIVPQPGPQEAFVRSRADITISGGARGGGKTYGLLMRPIYMPGGELGAFDDPQFTGVLFRREREQLLGPSRLWETVKQFYGPLGAHFNNATLEVKFPSGAHIKCAGLQYDDDTEKWRGNALVWIALEEGTQFTKHQMLELLRANRPSLGCAVKPWFDITCNPDPDCYLFELVQWYLYPEGHPKAGYPMPERSGALRHFTYQGDELVWVEDIWPGDPADWRDEEGQPAMTLTFIPSTVDDNPALRVTDPSYASKLRAQTHEKVERERKGNWLTRKTGGFFSRGTVRWVSAQDVPVKHRLAYWDLAATKREKPEGRNATAGVLCGLHRCEACDGWRYIDPHTPCKCNLRANGEPYVLFDDVPDAELSFVLFDATLQEVGPHELQTLMGRYAAQWGAPVPHYVEEETASSGKITTATIQASWLPAYEVFGDRPSGSKMARADELLRLSQRGLFLSVIDPAWQMHLNRSMRDFPKAGIDLIDALSGALNALKTHNFEHTFFIL